MTIHYAKGLEFPLVVLPDLDRQRNTGSWQPVLDVRLGPLVPLESEEKRGCIGLDLYRHTENLEDIEERKRLLYVACTRAADYLILSSSIDDPAKPKRDWLQLIDRHIDLTNGSLRGPLPAGYAAPGIRVITDKPRTDDEAVIVPRGADLKRLVSKTRELVAKSPGEIPSSSDAIGIDGSSRRRFSFSQLTGQLAFHDERTIETEELAQPGEAVATAPGADGRELGSLVHAVLERMDIRRRDGIRELCDFFAPQHTHAAPEALAAKAASMIERFFSSPRAAELVAAKVIRREVEFLLPWPPDGAGFVGRYMHGYIDCLYQDPQGRWRLLDYKTNQISAGGVAEATRRYELQMLVYSLACERALGQPLAECSIQLLDAGAEHQFQWDDAAQRNGVKQITIAMESLVRGG
jgi:ATP-dependent helicase/nuclease subunit A